MSFCKKNFKVAQNQEQSNERASQVNQAIQAIHESQANLVSQPKTVNFCFFQKNQIKRFVVLQKKLKSCSKSRISN